MPVDYVVPADLAAALEMRGAGYTVLAGGTDLYPQHVGRPMPERMVDIGGLADLRGIVETSGGVRLGALTRWADVTAAALPPAFDGLRAAAREVGAVQVQHAGTIGGNLCNASPAADGVPVLLTLDASVELTSASGTRSLALEAFLTGYRQTALGPDELLTAVVVPASPTARGRPSSSWPAALSGDLGRDGVRRRRPRRERRHRRCPGGRRGVLAGGPAVAVARVGARGPGAGRRRRGDGRPHLEALDPIDDVRASADYRRAAASVLVRRAIASCGDAR